MAPSKAATSSLKRKEATRPAPAAKKAKREPWSDINNAISAADVSEETKTLLLQVIPLSLGEFANKRHKFQDNMVEAIHAVLKDLEVGLEAEVSKAAEERVNAEQKKTSLEGDADQAMKTLEEKKSGVQELKKGLATDALAFRGAKKALEDCEEEKNAAAYEAVKSRNKKEEYETMLKQLAFLTAAAPEDAEAHKQNASLLAMVKKHGFEDSMLIALPAALKKAGEERGQFDKLTINGLESELNKRIAELDASIAAFAPTEQKHLAALEKAREILNAKSAKLRESAKVFQAAFDEESACAAATGDANKAVRDLVASLKRLGKVCNTTEAELQVFRAGPLATFKRLQEHEEPKEQEVETTDPMPEEVAPAVAAC